MWLVWRVCVFEHRWWAGQVSCAVWFQAEMQPGSEPESGFMEHLGFSAADLSRHLSDEKPGSNGRERERQQKIPMSSPSLWPPDRAPVDEELRETVVV